jgi:predicted Zn-ribbon and HTH transcriptional regulator
MHPLTIDKTVIAPCGMDCGICRAYLREKNKCPGCNSSDLNKPKYCIVCRIKNCEELEKTSDNYCFSCKIFPCARLKQLDKRYRTKYGMSMIDNLKKIKETGIDSFMVLENEKWVCEKCGDIICVHTWKCTKCGYQVKLL